MEYIFNSNSNYIILNNTVAHNIFDNVSKHVNDLDVITFGYYENRQRSCEMRELIIFLIL